MDRRLRRTPDAEWVLMYRLGLSRQRIADLVRVHPAVVGYHLVIARRQDPGLEATHQAATATKAGPSPTDLARMEETIAWTTAEGRLPRDRSVHKGERSMARWLSERRREAAEGTLSPAYRTGAASHESRNGPGTAGQLRTKPGGITGSPNSWTSAPKATTGPATTTTPQDGNTPSECGSGFHTPGVLSISRQSAYER
jgi:hypothetical protein